MNAARWRSPLGGAVLVLVMAWVPPIRHALEARMTVQMLVQIPLLVVAGWLLASAIPTTLRARIHRWNLSGVTGLALATMVSAFWMLPRSLDASISGPLMAAAKFLSVPLLIGVPFALSWPRMGFVVRGVFLAEVVATCFRLGWLYLVSPIRLCNNYGMDDQQRLGRYLLAIGVALLLWLSGKLLMGRFESLSGPPADHDRAVSGASYDADAFQDARLQGLCEDGAEEVASRGVRKAPDELGR